MYGTRQASQGCATLKEYATFQTRGNQRTFKRGKTNSTTGKPSYTLPTVFSLLLFYAFALQCMSTVAIVKKETGKTKWAVIQFVYMTVLAYGSSLLVFQVFS